MRVRILPYKIGSQSAKVLARELGYLRCNPNATRFRPRASDLIINWGCSYFPFYNGVLDRPYPSKWLNEPPSVGLASDKTRALTVMGREQVSVIPFTSDYETALEWLEREEGSYVYERHILSGHGGAGITVCTNSDNLNPNCKLYTKGIRIRREYRVHVFNGEVIDHVQKRKRFGAPDTNDYIRNHTHGWVFVREGFDRLEEVEREAINAVKALGLDFGAVDIITEKQTGNVYALEVNTAPGFAEGSTTLQKYTEAIRRYINGLH